MSKPGGLTPEKPADKTIQEICDKVKPQAEQMAGRNFSLFAAKSYATQLVAGTNYFIKVLIGLGGGDCVQIWVYENLPCDGSKLTLEKITFGNNLDDPIVKF